MEQALALELPRPFDGWLMGGLRRWEVNVRFVWGRVEPRIGGEQPG